MDFASADLDALLEEGMVVQFAADPAAKGVFRVAEVEVELESPFAGSGITKAIELHPTVLVRNDAIPSVAKHADITVGGTAYKVREVQRMSNGQWKRIILVTVNL